jgi:hypothetical protein
MYWRLRKAGWVGVRGLVVVVGVWGVAGGCPWPPVVPSPTAAVA